MHILGHQKNIDFLEESIRQKRLSHAYLFYGPGSLGKKLVAEVFALSLLRQKDPCFKCLFSTEVGDVKETDILRIQVLEDKKQIGIEQIRELQIFFSLTSLSGKYKIAIIDEAENMTTEAANSFLKTLEGPPRNAIIILVASHLPSVLPTIQSRCQILRFFSPTQTEFEQYFEESHHLKEKEAEELYYFSAAKPGLAIKYFLQPEEMAAAKQKTVAFVDFLSAPSSTLALELAKKSSASDFHNWLQIIRGLIYQKINLVHFYSAPQSKIIKVLNKYQLKDLREMISRLEEAIKQVNYYIPEQVVIENFLGSYIF